MVLQHSRNHDQRDQDRLPHVHVVLSVEVQNFAFRVQCRFSTKDGAACITDLSEAPYKKRSRSDVVDVSKHFISMVDS